MKKILLTGSSGFVGGNALSFLKKNYEVFAPKRNELDVRDYEQVKKCLEIRLPSLQAVWPIIQAR